MSDGSHVLAVNQSVHRLLQLVDTQVAQLPRPLLQFPHKAVVTRKAKGGTGDRLPNCLLALLRLNTRDTAAEHDLFRPLVTQCYYQGGRP